METPSRRPDESNYKERLEAHDLTLSLHRDFGFVEAIARAVNAEHRVEERDRARASDLRTALVKAVRKRWPWQQGAVALEELRNLHTKWATNDPTWDQQR